MRPEVGFCGVASGCACAENRSAQDQENQQKAWNCPLYRRGLTAPERVRPRSPQRWQPLPTIRGRASCDALHVLSVRISCVS